MNVMSVTRALSEIKRIDERLARATSDGSTFVSVSVGKGDKMKVLGSSDTVATVLAQIQSDRDRIEHLINTRAKIKAAVVLSNAMTKVKIAGREMSVAEAIELNKSIETKRQLLNIMRRQLINANALINKQNASLEAQIEANLATIYGNDKGKVEASMFDAIAKPQREQKEASLIDPSDINQRIKTLDDEISIIDSEIDFSLSESNARTEISF